MIFIRLCKIFIEIEIKKTRLEDFVCRAAIEEGKAIFHNIRNFVRFQLSTYVDLK
jgi:hypothetical protein